MTRKKTTIDHVKSSGNVVEIRVKRTRRAHGQMSVVVAA